MVGASNQEFHRTWPRPSTFLCSHWTSRPPEISLATRFSPDFVVTRSWVRIPIATSVSQVYFFVEHLRSPLEQRSLCAEGCSQQRACCSDGRDRVHMEKPEVYGSGGTARAFATTRADPEVVAPFRPKHQKGCPPRKKGIKVLPTSNTEKKCCLWQITSISLPLLRHFMEVEPLTYNRF